MLSAIDELARTLGGLADQVQVLRGEADQEIGRTVDAINAELQTIHELNVEIQRLGPPGQVNPELLDRRDALVRSLAEKIDVRTYAQDNGTLAIYTAGGEALLDATPRALIYEPASSGDRRHRVRCDRDLPPRTSWIPATGQPLDPNAGVELVERRGARDALTPSSRTMRSPMPTSRSPAGSAAAGSPVCSRAATGSCRSSTTSCRSSPRPCASRSTPRTTTRARCRRPAQLSGSRTDLADFAAATRSGTATFAVIDHSDGSTLLAFQIDVGAAADEARSRPRSTPRLGAFGSAAIGAGGNLEITLADGGQGLAIAEGDSAITITDAAGRDRDYGLAHYFGLNDLLVSAGSRASDFAVRADIAGDPALLGTARLDVQAGPPLVASLGGRGDNRGAQALADALAAAQPMLARGGLAAKSVTLATYAGDIIARSAVLAQSAEQTAEPRPRAGGAAGRSAPRRSRASIWTRRWPAWCSCSRPTPPPPALVAVTEELFDELLGMVR